MDDVYFNLADVASHCLPQLAAAVASWKPDLVFETGVEAGFSTRFLLNAIAPKGRLVSVENIIQYETPHPRWTLLRGTSHRMLPKAYEDFGPPDVFIHDSDHEVECQSFEYELAWNIVRPGGHILSDDVVWAGHGAWAKFVSRYGLKDEPVASYGCVTKPLDGPTPPRSRRDLHIAVYGAWKLSQRAAIAICVTPRYTVEEMT
jgi:hypothetical protein